MSSSAKCLCGAVRIAVSSPVETVGACHCNMCRRWGGGPLIAVNCGTHVSIEGQDSVSVFDSSPWAERGFCSRCGSHLFYRLKHNKHCYVPAGLFEGSQSLVFASQVFIDQKPDYYAFANETQNMTAAEIFAKFAPKSD